MAATHVDPIEARQEARTAAKLLMFALALVVFAVVTTAIWGLPALAMIGLAGPVTVFGVLIAYAAGF